MPLVVISALPLRSSHGVHCSVQPSLSAHCAASPNCHCLPGGNEARVTGGAQIASQPVVWSSKGLFVSRPLLYNCVN